MAKEEQNHEEKIQDQVEAARQKFDILLSEIRANYQQDSAAKNETNQLGVYDTPEINAVARLANDDEAMALLYQPSKKAASIMDDNDEFSNRKQFLNEIPLASKTKSSDPIGASITLEELLGTKDLVDKFINAMIEEVNTKAFRDAVFNQSATEYEGDKWEKRPIAVVGGPSASGKTSITKTAIKQNQVLFGKKASDNVSLDNTSGVGEDSRPQEMGSSEEIATGNDSNIIVASDGGVVREVCQMRNLIIDYARSLGYSEISDLHAKTSKILEPVKESVQNAVLSTKDIGLAVPLTFAKGSERKNLDKLMELENDPNNVLLFINVKPQQYEAVEQQGTTRSKETAWGKIGGRTFSLNKSEGRPEFKPYGGKPSYKMGMFATQRQVNKFSKKSKNGFIINGINDLRKGPGLPISIRVKERWEAFASCDTSYQRLKNRTNKGGKKISQEEVYEARKDLAKYINLCKKYCYKGSAELTKEQKEIFGPEYLDFEMEASAQLDIATGCELVLENLPEFYGNDRETYKDLIAAKENLIEKIKEIKKEGYSVLVMPDDKKNHLDTLKSAVEGLKDEMQKYTKGIFSKNDIGFVAKTKNWYQASLVQWGLGGDVSWLIKYIVVPIQKVFLGIDSIEKGIKRAQKEKENRKETITEWKQQITANKEIRTTKTQELKTAIDKLLAPEVQKNDEEELGSVQEDTVKVDSGFIGKITESASGLVSGLATVAASGVAYFTGRSTSVEDNQKDDRESASNGSYGTLHKTMSPTPLDEKLKKLNIAIKRYVDDEKKLPMLYTKVYELIIFLRKDNDLDHGQKGDLQEKLEKLKGDLESQDSFTKNFSKLTKKGVSSIAMNPEWYPCLKDMNADAKKELMAEFKSPGFVEKLTKGLFKGTTSGKFPVKWAIRDEENSDEDEIDDFHITVPQDNGDGSTAVDGNNEDEEDNEIISQDDDAIIRSSIS